MSMDANNLGAEVAAALRVAGLIAGDTPAEIDNNEAQAAMIWETVGGALINHISTNADISIGVADAALQTSTAVGVPTAGPAVPVTLTGAIS